ncbi:non-ribosomal peptide synthetase [uncultured Shewanella sp.]|uniref:non-ribosomal peptide synthetase n=1 Tax=uncultured Shewanella sp. TaxID=173975 RepID=UPI00260D1A51|nr:non-ribosomal peptide synthetase [uncultured Shewanella sp.]
MTFVKLLNALKAAQIRVWSTDGKLNFKAPKGKFTKQIKAAMIEHKAELIGFVSDDVAVQGPVRVAADEPVALSQAQQSLWVFEQMHPDCHYYHSLHSIEINGQLNEATLQSALNLLIQRHQALRTSVEEHQGVLLQKVRDTMSIPLHLKDFSTISDPVQADEALAQAARVLAAADMDWQNGQMLHCSLFKTQPQKQVLCLVIHHAFCDGGSLNLIFDQLLAIYQQLTLGQTVAVTDDWQYRDYSRWEEGYLSSEQYGRDQQFWLDYLSDWQPLELPTTKARGPVQCFGGKRFEFELPALLGGQIKDYAKAQGATVFSVLMAAYNLILSRYSGQSDILVGSVSSNRTHQNLFGVVGNLLNTIVVRSEVNEQNSFSQLVKNVNADVRNIQEHQRFPYDAVLQSLSLERNMDRNGLFQAFFVLQPEISLKQGAQGLHCMPYEIDPQLSVFDLKLNLQNHHDSFAGYLEYADSLFSEAFIHAMVDNFIAIVSSAINCDGPLMDLATVTAQQHQQLNELNNTRQPYPEHLRVIDLIEQQIATTPENIAVRCGEQQLSYAQLNEQANQLARYLVEHHQIKANQIVALCLTPGVDFYVGLLAILKTGAAYLPIESSYPDERKLYLLQDAEAVLVITCAEYNELLTDCNTPSLDIRATTQVWQCGDSSNLAIAGSPSDLFYIMYTSGSTGKPKGALISNKNEVNLLHWYGQAFDLCAQDKVYIISVLGFDLTQKNLFAPLLHGACAVLREGIRFDPVEIEQTIAQQQISFVNCAPSAFYALVETVTDPARLSSLRCVLFGGEPINLERLAGWTRSAGFAAQIINMYGPTECTDISNYHQVSKTELAELATVTNLGQANPNVQLLIVDQHLRLVPYGVPGELCIAGDSVGKGYWRREQLTEEKFVDVRFAQGPRQKVYRTGDLVKYSHHQDIEFIGRLDDQVKIRGLRIELGEIEKCIKAIAGVEQAVVVLFNHQNEQSIGAYVLSKTLPKILRADIKRHLSKVLPDYMHPAAIEVVAAIPLTANGKVDRKALPEFNVACALAVDESRFEPLQGELEHTIAAIWQTVTGWQNIGAGQNFFASGGHSLLATRIIARFRSQLGIKLGINDFFNQPTIREQACFIAGLTKNHSEVIPRLSAEQAPPLSDAQSRLWFVDQLEGASAKYNINAALKVAGDVNVKAVSQALNAVIARHDVLRTNFVQVQGKAALEIHPHRAIEVELQAVDFDGAAIGRIDDFVTAAGEHVFDLAQDLLINCRLAQMTDGRHLMVLSIHHIVADGWSMGVLVDEFCHFYRVALGMNTEPLAPLSIQYQDYALWHKQQWRKQQNDSEKMQQQLAFWLEHLRDCPQTHSLPLDRQRCNEQSALADSLSYQWQSDTVKAMDKICAQYQLTRFNLLQGMLSLLLATLSGTGDIVIGTAIANRESEQTEPMVGFFVNNMAIRTQLDRQSTLAAFFGRVKQQFAAAMDCQDVPFEMLVEQLQCERNLGIHPLFQVMFVMQQDSSSAIDWPGGSMQLLATQERLAKFDLTVEIVEKDNDIAMNWTYAQQLWDQQTIRLWMDYFVAAIEQVVNQPELRLSEVDFNQGSYVQHTAGSGQLHQLEQLPLYQQIVARNSGNGDKTAVVDADGQTLSYDELIAQAHSVATALIASGFGAGSRVGLMLPRNTQAISAILGCLFSGAAYVYVDPDYPKARIERIIEQADLAILVVDQLDSSDNHKVSLQSLCNTTANADLVTERWATASMSDPAYYIFTSGSTGLPKGVEVTQRNLVYSTDARLGYYRQSVKNFLLLSSLSFDSSVAGLFWTLISGGKLMIASAPQINAPEAIVALIESSQISHLLCVPSLYRLISNVAGAQTASSLETVIVAGEACKPDLVQQHYQSSWTADATLYNEYGPTEATVWSVAHRCELDDAEGAIPIGKPIPHVGFAVMDSQGKPVAPTIPGELWLSGPLLSNGYLNDQTRTDEVFVIHQQADGSQCLHYRTGDVVRLSHDGKLHYLGRNDNQVKLNGLRVFLGEIESLLSTHDDVLQAAVIVAKTPAGSDVLVAYYVTDTSENSDDDERFSLFMSQHLPGGLVPRVYIKLDSLPLSEHGKVDRRQLVLPDFEQSKDAIVAAENDREKALLAVFKAVLKTDKIGVTDNFFSIGGDSISAIQIVSEALKNGYKLTTKDLFLYQSVRQLARHIARLDAAIPAFSAWLGPVGLTAIQTQFLRQNPGQTHYNQSLSFKLSSAVDVDVLSSAITSVLQKHDLLRAVYCAEQGTAEVLPDSAQMLNHAFVTIQSPQLEVSQGLIDQHQVEIQQSFDLAKGPLFKCFAFITAGQLQHFILAAHHLVIDGVSWRIVAQDLTTALEQAVRSEPINLAPRTAGLQHWVDYLQQYSQSQSHQKARQYWYQWAEALDSRQLTQWQPQGLVGDVHQCKVSLNVDMTSKLRQTTAGVFNANINEILLGAVFKTWQQWSQQSQLLLDLEGHGRDGIDHDVDLSQTVGWFTNVYPLLLDSEGQTQWSEIIGAVKAGVKPIPNKGMDLPLLKDIEQDLQITEVLGRNPSTLIFNYLGVTDTPSAGETLLGLSELDPGQPVCLAAKVSHALAVNCEITNDCFSLKLDADNCHFSAQQTADLAQQLIDNLQQLIDFAAESTKTYQHPCDFPQVSLTGEELETLQQQYPHVSKIYPATGMQQALIFHSQLTPDSGVYATQLSLNLSNIHLPHFKAAWQHVVQSFDIFRSGFKQRSQDTLQFVVDRCELPWEEMDLSALDSGAQPQMIAGLEQSQKCLPFELETPCLMRLLMVQLGENHYQFIWTHHHSLLDGWSQPIVMAQLIAAYRTLQNKQLLKPADNPQFDSYLRWLADYDVDQAQQYWQQYLSVIEEAPQLPLSHVVDNAQEKYCKVKTVLEVSQVEQLQARSSQLGVTMSTLFQLAWAKTLASYKNSDSVTFGMTVSGRPAQLPEVNELAGLMINTVPVHVDLAAQTSLDVLVQKIQSDQVERMAHELLPLPDIVKQHPLSGELIDSVVVFENYPVGEAIDDEITQAGIVLHGSNVNEQTSFPLTLAVLPGKQFTVELHGNDLKLSPEVIQRMLSQLEQVLALMVDQDVCSVEQLNVLGQQEQQMLAKFEAGEQAQVCEQTLDQQIAAKAAAYPHHIAVQEADRQLSYARLEADSTLVARYLQQQGVKAGQVVAVCLPKGCDQVIATLAVLKSGAIYLPVDAAHPSQRIDFMLQDAQVSHFFAGTTEQLRTWGAGRSVIDIEAVLASGEAGLAPLNSNHNTDSGAYIIYTSGSTGQPKAVVCHHRGVNNMLHSCQRIQPLTATERCAWWSNFCFDVSVYEMFAPLIQGATLVIVPETVIMDGPGFVDWLSLQKISAAYVPPFFVGDWLASCRQGQGPAMKRVLVGVEPIDEQALSEIQSLTDGLQIINGYGPSETTICSTLYPLTTDIDKVRTTPIGRPVINSSVCVLNSKGQRVPLGVPGELHIAGAGVSHGYLNNRAMTDEKFSELSNAKVHYKTGDIVRWLPCGNLAFVGRADEQVKIRGFRVEPGEVTRQLSLCDGVATCLVMVTEVQPGNKRLVAYVEPDQQAPIDETALTSQIKRQLQAGLPSYMVPADFVVVRQWPLTPNRKIDKKALPQPGAAAEQVSPATPNEFVLASICAELLKLDSSELSVTTSFFELGGHSLLLVRLLSAIEQQTEVKLELAQIFDNATIREMAKLVDYYQSAGQLEQLISNETELELHRTEF